MELIDKVLTALKLCQTLECAKCPYFNLNKGQDCQFQLLAKDAEIIIKNLKLKAIIEKNDN